MPFTILDCIQQQQQRKKLGNNINNNNDNLQQCYSSRQNFNFKKSVNHVANVVLDFFTCFIARKHPNTIIIRS
ncbi:hypothetical protein DERP_004682 [Dermatophagoides pteronyssinus]|uniref:Uncharacterized protein n=1 Tax=Dermatophagoides pteronyssinus TaxID=6956 RepID=A0ABQ8JQ24_DERPT|nr:hypothetical protein DERP_004682 [Dermatophagoides pteronyssinus]